MQKILLLSVLAIAFLLVNTSNSFACSCALPSPTTSLKQRVAEAKKDAKAVFSAEVLEIEPQPGGHVVKVKLKVDKIWKRDLLETVTVLTGKGNGDCGYSFSIGVKYLVYAHGTEESGNFLGASMCSRTQNIEAAEEELKVLGEPKGMIKKK